MRLNVTYFVNVLYIIFLIPTFCLKTKTCFDCILCLKTLHCKVTITFEFFQSNQFKRQARVLTAS